MIWWVLLLFIGGMVLILAEFILPGGILGIMGGVMFITSMGLGIYAYPEHVVPIVIGELVGAAVVITFGLFVVSKGGFARGLTLQESQYAEEGYVNLPTDASLIGAEGTVFSALRPSGTIIVGNERIDAVSDGVFIPKDAHVRVVEVHGNRVVVEPVDQAVAQE